jgi:hypothetical protein
MTTGNFCFYLQNRLFQTSQTGGQWYNDTFPPLVFPGSTIWTDSRPQPWYNEWSVSTTVPLQRSILFFGQWNKLECLYLFKWARLSPILASLEHCCKKAILQQFGSITDIFSHESFSMLIK